MRRVSFILNGLGFCLIYWGLELTIKIKKGEIPYTNLDDLIVNPDTVLMSLSISAIMLFMIAMTFKMSNLTNSTSLHRTGISYTIIIALLILSLGVEMEYWYLTLAICFGVGGILAHPFRYTPSGSIETLLRLIALSSIAAHVVVSMEAGRSWAISLFILVHESFNYITILYSLLLLPLIYAPLGIKLYSRNGGYMLHFLTSMLFPLIVIYLAPVDKYSSLILVVSFLYFVIMVSLYGRYVRKLTLRDTRFGRITSNTIEEETTLNERVLFAILPDDVYRLIFKLN